MTSSTEDSRNSDLINGKALETLIIASVRTLKRCPLLDSETNGERFPFKKKFGKFRVQAINEIKALITKEISVLKKAITTHSNIDVLSRKAQT